MSRLLRYTIVVVAALLVVFVGGPWVYINFIREDAPESFVAEVTVTTVASGDATTTTAASDDSTVDGIADPSGVWTVTSESQAGYRVDEVLFGQNVTAVGRTNAIVGTVEIASNQVQAATFEVDMTTVTSDEPKRDAQFASRIMDVLNYPTATFVLESPIVLPADAPATSTTHTARGALTLRGTTKTIDFTIASTVRDGRIVVIGETQIVFADWNIPNPSIPGISTEDFGVLEFNLVLER